MAGSAPSLNPELEAALAQAASLAQALTQAPSAADTADSAAPLLGALRQVQRLIEARTAGQPRESDPGPLQALWCVLSVCQQAAARLWSVPPSLAPAAAAAVLAALQTLRQSPVAAPPGSVAWACAVFPAYSAVAHLAGASRVHPGDLWSEPRRAPGGQAAVEALRAAYSGEGGLPPALAPEPALLPPFDEALQRVLREPGPDAFGRMSALCVGLAQGSPATLGDTWTLAAALYEALHDALLSLDPYLKRASARLRAQLRAQAGLAALPDAPTQALLEHELRFACARALQAATDGAHAPGPCLQAAAQAAGLAADLALPGSTPPPPLPSGPVAPSAALKARVPDLPSPDDLDPSQWATPDATLAPLSDTQRVIGPLRIDIARLNAFLQEADERSRRLQRLLSEWVLLSAQGEPHPAPQATEDAAWLAAHTSAIGHAALGRFIEVLAHTLAALTAAAPVPVAAPQREAQALRLEAAARETARVLHQFAAGFLKPPSEPLLQALQSELPWGSFAVAKSSRDAAAPLID